jgi:phosphosulfolactate synthase (CoM biosynthesis protein A)
MVNAPSLGKRANDDDAGRSFGRSAGPHDLFPVVSAMEERALSFIPSNRRESKPRRRGLTEVRGPYYTPMGTRYLSDLLETMGDWIDSMKFAGGSFRLMPHARVKELIELCHQHEVTVSTGGFVEHLLALQREELVRRYVDECKRIGFDIVEISMGFMTLPSEDFLRLIELVRSAGLTPKAEVGVQFGAGGATRAETLEAEGQRDVKRAIDLARKCLETGPGLIMIESEGITESVHEWRTEVIAAIANELGLERVMFEAADPAVFEWYVKNYGPEVNLFVDHSQVIQLEALRSGIWGTQSLFGRVATFKGD